MTKWITDVPVVSNYRDLSVSSFPSNLVYRSADLSQLERSSLPSLAKYINTIIDVRSMPEIRRNGTIGPPDQCFTDSELAPFKIKRIHAPIFLESDYSPAAIAKRHKMYQSGTDGFLEAYRGILSAIGPTLRTVFAELAKNISDGMNRGILIHCSAGKDRTGILCALLLLLAQITPEEVSEEYSLTTQGLAEQHERILSSLGSWASSQDRETARMMMSSEAIVMTRTLGIIDAEYGGAESLIQKHVDASDYEIVKNRVRQADQAKL